jgi:hypothetical protein
VDHIERLLALEEIKWLKARYWRFMDTKQWDMLLDVFTPDAELDARGAGPSGGTAGGRAEVVAYIRSHVGLATTVHHGHQPEIELTSDTTARGVWAFEDLLQWHDGQSLGGVTSIHGWGHYHDRYEKAEDGWRIAFTSMTRLRVDQQ